MAKKSYITYGLDSMGGLHLFKGKRKVYYKGKMFVDAKGNEADLYIQNNDEVQRTLEDLNDRFLGVGEWDSKEDVMGIF